MKFLFKLFKLERIVLSFFVVVSMFLFAPFDQANKNYAFINNPLQGIIKIPPGEFENKKLIYTFQIPSKLEGTGEIELIFDENGIKGLAKGEGKASKCKMDFNTDIKGTINKLNGAVEIILNGVGKPLGIFLPGKITYNGPLKGKLNYITKNLLLKGTVAINGRLASLGGFNKSEDIEIEIQTNNQTALLTKK